MTRHAKEHPGHVALSVRELLDGQLNTIEITTPGSAGDELKIAHDLGRIPNGYIIVNRPYTGTAMDHGEGATDWDETNIYLKFSATDTVLTIAVY